MWVLGSQCSSFSGLLLTPSLNQRRLLLLNLIVSFLRQRFLYKAETAPHSSAALTSNSGIDHARTTLACKSFGLNPAKYTAYGSLCMICPFVVRDGLFYVLLEGQGGRWGS